MADVNKHVELQRAAQEARYADMERLIQDGGCVDHVGESNCCALQVMASVNRDLNVIPSTAQVNVNIGRDKTGPKSMNSPLYYAVKKGNLKNVRWLLSRGADTDKVSPNNQSALDLVPVKHVDMIKLLVSCGANKWTEGKDVKRDEVIREAVLDHNANQDKVSSLLDISALTAEKLQWLAEGDDISVINVDDVRVQLDVLDATGNTLMHLATAKARMNNVTFLLEKSLLVNVQNGDGDSCLHIAVRMNNTAMVKLLLAHGADVRLTNKKRETPLHLCHFNSSLLKCLIVSKCDTDAITREGETAVMVAVRWEDEENLRMLLEHNPAINAQNKHGDTALHLSVSRGMDLVRLLLRDKPDVNVKNLRGEIPVHCAARRLHVDMVEALLTAGADPNMADSCGQTPLDVAVSMSVIRCLVLRGATVWKDNNTRKDQAIHKLIKERKPASETSATVPAGEATVDSYKCKICYEFPVDTLLQPCLHLCVCHQCSPNVLTCPVCRDTPHAKLRLHIP